MTFALYKSYAAIDTITKNEIETALREKTKPKNIDIEAIFATFQGKTLISDAEEKRVFAAIQEAFVEKEYGQITTDENELKDCA